VGCVEKTLLQKFTALMVIEILVGILGSYGQEYSDAFLTFSGQQPSCFCCTLQFVCRLPKAKISVEIICSVV